MRMLILFCAGGLHGVRSCPYDHHSGKKKLDPSLTRALKNSTQALPMLKAIAS